MADILRPLHAACICESSESEKLLIELCRKCLNPLPQFLRDKRFQNLCQAISGAIRLIACRLIDKCDDSDMGEAASQNLARFSKLVLRLKECVILPRPQVHFAYFRQEVGTIAIRRSTAKGPEYYGFRIFYHIRNIGLKVV